MLVCSAIKWYSWSYLDQPLSDFPGKHPWVVILVLLDLLLHLGSGDPRLGSANDAGPDGASFLVAVQDLGDAAVADSQLTGYDTWPDAGSSHFNDLEADVIG